MYNNNIEVARKIAEEIEKYGGKAYYVGGFVRDKLLGKDSYDIDIEIHNVSVNTLKKVLDSTVQYTQVGKSFGIFSLKKYDIDIAMPRTEVQTGKGHKDVAISVEPFAGTYNAAQRRDFTINAIMEDIISGKIIDHFNGREDLKQGVIRHINEDTFTDDPLRILRAAQFGARMGFKVCDSTIELSQKTDLSFLSKERVYDELKKALIYSKKPSIFFEIIKKMKQLSPWFEKLCTLNKNWDLTMESLDRGALYRKNTKMSDIFMLCCLCARFQTKKDVEEFVRGLTADTKTRKYVLNMYVGCKELYEAEKNNAREYVTNFIFDESMDKEMLLLVIKAVYGEQTKRDIFISQRLSIYNTILKEGYITGKELIDMGLRPDKNFSALLKKAKELQFRGEKKANIISILSDKE